MKTIEMKDENNNIVQAKVGDTIASFCPISKRAVVGKIERIKNGFQACGLKITPKASKCVFIAHSQSA